MGWISRIADSVKTAFKTARQPFPKIPPELLLCNSAQKPGLSAALLASAIIARLPEIGIDTGKNEDGSPNKVCQFVALISEEFVKHIRDNAKVEVGLSSFGLTIKTDGANAAGPVSSQGSNIQPITMEGEVF